MEILKQDTTLQTLTIMSRLNIQDDGVVWRHALRERFRDRSAKHLQEKQRGRVMEISAECWNIHTTRLGLCEPENFFLCLRKNGKKLRLRFEMKQKKNKINISPEIGSVISSTGLTYLSGIFFFHFFFIFDLWKYSNIFLQSFSFRSEFNTFLKTKPGITFTDKRCITTTMFLWPRNVGPRIWYS